MDKIDAAVIAYQLEQTDELFLEMYEELSTTRKKCFGRTRKSLPTTVSDADILGLIDDAILSCAERFDCSKGSSFVTYLCREIEDRRKDQLRYLNAEKRRGDVLATPLDAPVDGDAGTTLGEQLPDYNAPDVYDILAAENIITSLQHFKESSEKNRVYASILAFDSTYFATREEKHNAMRQLLGQNFSTSGIHKKVKKAKLAFQTYLAEKN